MENHYNCIYMYTNKINGKGYVGQTVNFKQRHQKHISAMTNENDDEYDAPIQRAFRKYGLDNFEVKILKENLNTQCLLNFYECYYIKNFDLLCKNGKGYNLSDGGSNGNPFAGKTEEEIKEIRRNQSEAHKGENNPMYGIHRYGKDAPMYGKKHSEETKQKQSEANKGENHPMYGKKHSKEVKQKISENHADFSGENHPQAKRVAQYDKQGNLIKIWDYAKQVTEELGINNGNIIKCCKGKLKSAGGYIWRYADIEETK